MTSPGANGGAATPEQNDDIIAMDADNEPITVSRGVLVAVLDVATQSMDFGSGFLNDFDLEALRRLAFALNLDPMNATPRTHKCQYAGTHSWTQQTWGALGANGGWYCVLCRHTSATKPADAEQSDRKPGGTA